MGNKVSMVLAIAMVTFVCTAQAGNGGSGGNGSGNAKNDLGYNTKPPVARYIWQDGKLVANPAYTTAPAKINDDIAERTAKQ